MKKQKNKKKNPSVKIIAGSWKGRIINFFEDKDVRPTKNIVKETLFNWLKDDIAQSVCFDLYAGSGSLGFEAASRGARKVYMVDKNTDVINCIKNCIVNFKAKNIYTYKIDAFKFLEKIEEKCNIVFLDPPFSDKSIDNIIKKVDDSNVMQDRCKIYIELPFSKNEKYNITVPANWNLIKNCKSGDVSYLLYEHNKRMI
jgi:16S rRNA (guanine966-N2)-methyltransferase